MYIAAYKFSHQKATNSHYYQTVAYYMSFYSKVVLKSLLPSHLYMFHHYGQLNIWYIKPNQWMVLLYLAEWTLDPILYFYTHKKLSRGSSGQKVHVLVHIMCTLFDKFTICMEMLQNLLLLRFKYITLKWRISVYYSNDIELQSSIYW